MKVYYVFYINNYFSYVYKNKTYKLYKLIEEMFHIKEYDVVLTYRYFEQIALTFDKERLNEYIYNKLYENEKYYKRNNIHIINDKYEDSKLVINNSNLKIKTNTKYSQFISILKEYSDNLFVCDFYNKDYFWLEKSIGSNCQNDKSLVK